MQAAERLAPESGLKAACSALGVPRATVYRRRSPPPPPAATPRPSPSRALTEPERQHVLEVLRSERFVDQAPHQVYATLLDENRYYCSIRTMYRILEANGEVKERRDQLRHPTYAKPELRAEAPRCPGEASGRARVSRR